MLQDQYSDTRTHTDTRVLPGLAARQSRFSRVLRHVLTGVGFALLLSCLKGVLWVLNPGQLFGGGPSHSLAAFLALPARMPLLLLMPVFEVALGAWLSWLVALPLAQLAYLKAIRQAQEVYRARYTPLQNWSYPYEVSVLYARDDPDPTTPRQTESLTVPDVIGTVMAAPTSHLILLGAQGAGKTMFVYEYLSAVAQQRRKVVFGRLSVPLFLPLKYYALLLQASDPTGATDFSLLDFLGAYDLPGLNHLRPYLARLFKRGRLHFLCDGLDEVPALYRPMLDQQLTLLFRQNRNGLLLTCTPEVYEQSSTLVRIIGENLVPRATFQPLDQAHTRGIVERYITEMDTRYRPNLPTAGQVMNALERTRLRLICTTPLYLFALLALVDTLPIEEIKELDTRGRLLHAFLLERLGNDITGSAAVSDDLLFLRDLACVVRWNGDSDLLCLPEEGFLALSVPEQQVHSERAIQQALDYWAREQQVRFPFAENTVFSLAETLPMVRAISILQRTYQAALIDIDGQGILRFRHPLIASALLAEYLASFLGAGALRIADIETLPDDLVPWSEPLTLWAGMLDDPLEAANMLATHARKYPERRVRALLASLICLGVAQTPPGVEHQQPPGVPPALELALSEILDNPPVLAELANLLLDCAAQGSPELYQALFPLLLISGSEVFIAQLAPATVSDLFFQRLVESIDDVSQDTLVKRLVKALSSWGAAVVPRAAWLCDARSRSGGRLRTAAINILGGTHEATAVEPLMGCLRDPDPFIVKRVSNALVRLGPDLTLPRLLRELNTRATAGTQKPLHAMILPILEHFLDETAPTFQLRPDQLESIIQALMSLLTTHTILADLEMARAILVNQSRLAEERDSGKMAVRMLAQNLATTDDKVAHSMTGALKEVGSAATPRLLAQLEKQPSETECMRILEVLASVRDERALPTLLRLLAHSSVVVQRTLAITLAAYAPACIPGLIDTVLHHANELVATRAEQILSELGGVVVEPVIQALTPQVAGRTLLLVAVLERVGDTRAVPALIFLLDTVQPSDVALALAIVQAFGHFADEQVIRPLLAVLTSSNPLLYEGAINALSNLGELACAELLTRLDTAEKTPEVARIERALLGMQPFPGDALLQTVDEGSEYQARYIEEIFLARGAEAAQLLATNLFHPQPHVSAWIRQVLSRMDGRYAVPALLEVLNRAEPAWRELLSSYLLKYPQEAIPPLVGLLDDPERGEAAVSILLRAGRPVLSALVPALAASHGVVQERAVLILVTLVQGQVELLADVIQLFGLTLPQRAREALVRVLTEDLAAVSLPALLAGLEDAHLVREVSVTLVRLAHRSAAQCAAVLEGLLQALRAKNRRYGASLTLIDLGAVAVPGVGALITDADPQVAHDARHILAEVGVPAFAFLWAAHSDASNPARREAAREVFRAMPTPIVKDELVELLSSARQEDISMALALLLERIHDEALQPGRVGEMLPSLLEHVQSSNDERINLRILALLLLLGGPTVAQTLVRALYANPQHHEQLVRTFLLLGQGVEADLLATLRDHNAPAQLQAEVAGILAMRVPNRDIQVHALGLSEHGLWAGRSASQVTTVLQAPQLDVSLRALGGLLVAGHWNSTELQNLRSASKAGSAEHELYSILLGWRYSPQITHLEHELMLAQEERKQDLFAHTQEMVLMKAQMVTLEGDLDELRREHEEQHHGHEQKSKELEDVITNLTGERQRLQADLHRVAQEKQMLTASSQQASKEKERLQAEAQRWQTYSQQLERDLNALRRPGSGS